MSEEVVLICAPVADHPEHVVGSEVRWCEICACEVWIAPSGIRRNPTQIICIPCAPGVMDTHPDARLEPIALDQIDELKRMTE